DFTNLDGGGCMPSVDGVPEKCIPDALFTGVDNPNGACMEAAVPAAAIGQTCGSDPVVVDSCVPGALCLALNNASGGFGGQFCCQSCNLDGSGTQCPSGKTCEALFQAQKYVGACIGSSGC
ncbi:MAG TPA: hypothetical protein VMB50_08105, partial [Myxococcales bacterium]|nr:hypothetical protein [Myxococcales bacterium]